MATKRSGTICASVLAACLWSAGVGSRADEPAGFRVGVGRRDITPPAGVPMWGYGARHDALAEGSLDPLLAGAIVIEAGDRRLAIVGADLGRGPTPAMMDRISRAVAEAGIQHVLIAGSHTHHGPVIELVDEDGLGRGKFDVAVAYNQALPGRLVEAIREAAAGLKPARIGVATEDVPLNRNRHTKRQPKPTDPRLAVVRFDDESGTPIAVLVNYAAHPVMTDAKVLKFSADYPGFLRSKVEAELGTTCVFMPGAAGDMSTNPGEGLRGPRAYGEALADHAIALARAIRAERPGSPAIAGKVDRFHFATRIDLGNPLVAVMYGRAFFPELVGNVARDFAGGIDAELSTILLNGDLALVGVPGEFFCNHAVRLRERSYVGQTLFFGYCNGHALYFPTIEAASEGGYGADPYVSPVEVGAGEQMMNRALINLYTLQGKFSGEPR